MTTDEKRRETLIRQTLECDGYLLHKSRRRTGQLWDQGEYMVVDRETNLPSFGWNWDATLEDLERWIAE